jgi:DNA-binding IscR family transcriptional regulator
MSDSQRFPVACHVLGYLAHSGATSADTAVASAVLASSIGTNPVVVRRVTALLSQAGLIATRAGASGGAWLLKQPDEVGLDQVLRAVNGCAHLGVPPPGNAECPMGQHIPKVVGRAITAADHAAAHSLSGVSVADLIKAA